MDVTDIDMNLASIIQSNSKNECDITTCHYIIQTSKTATMVGYALIAVKPTCTKTYKSMGKQNTCVLGSVQLLTSLPFAKFYKLKLKCLFLFQMMEVKQWAVDLI